ncbi:VOC family protein [Blastopirellula retiformator]|uniref:Glyoxalase/fosfomycin resistance/dioxygenase domain-containing protein n=1 Tax=Blastopirellula retiformator TaxID=2527970 RepID=A0A5C5VN62_9BACT|nr:VOC family protein [Blastopirellula retiformator]TWT39331.1 hypothetical protein Enr8_10290 [Blastopirellula retiformator]
MHVSPYLFFNGNCREALAFYAELFGATVEAMFPYAGSPSEEQVSADFRDKIMHACLTVGETHLMASDCPPEVYDKMQGMKVSLALADPTEAERIFAGLSQQGDIEMPLQETFWAYRFGMVTDRFGTPWMINCGKPEMDR